MAVAAIGVTGSTGNLGGRIARLLRAATEQHVELLTGRPAMSLEDLLAGRG